MNRFLCLSAVFLFYSSACGMNDGGDQVPRQVWTPPSTSLEELRQRHTQGNEGIRDYGDREEAEASFNRRNARVIEQVRRFFTHWGSKNIEKNLNAIEHLIRELREYKLDPSRYLLQEWKQVYGHTILFHLVRLSARYEQRGPGSIPLFLATFVISALLPIITRLLTNNKPLTIGALFSAIVLGYYLYPYLVSLFSISIFKKELASINGVIERLYSYMEASNIEIDEETIRLIKSLYAQNRNSRLLTEVFGVFCKDEKCNL